MRGVTIFNDVDRRASVSADAANIWTVVAPWRLATAMGGEFVLGRIINSLFGEVLKSICENEQRAISLGYKTDQYKLLAFILSGTLAGFAGSLKVFVAQNASLNDVHWSMSGESCL
ncbi:ABC-type branched-subunit amino acid transport system permease subunit [Bradyrhizobium yuanmingense]